MPFASAKQKRFFGACEGGHANLKCPPKKVLDEFFAADRAAHSKPARKRTKRKQP